MSDVKWQLGCVYERSIARAACDRDRLMAIKLAIDASNKRINDTLLSEMNKRERLIGELKNIRKRLEGRENETHGHKK